MAKVIRNSIKRLENLLFRCRETLESLAGKQNQNSHPNGEKEFIEV